MYGAAKNDTNNNIKHDDDDHDDDNNNNDYQYRNIYQKQETILGDVQLERLNSVHLCEWWTLDEQVGNAGDISLMMMISDEDSGYDNDTDPWNDLLPSLACGMDSW